VVASLGGVASAAPTTSARRTVTPTAISNAVRFISQGSLCGGDRHGFLLLSFFSFIKLFSVCKYSVTFQ
jgi:hypothetical protein